MKIKNHFFQALFVLGIALFLFAVPETTDAAGHLPTDNTPISSMNNISPQSVGCDGTNRCSRVATYQTHLRSRDAVVILNRHYYNSGGYSGWIPLVSKERYWLGDQYWVTLTYKGTVYSQ